MDANQLRRAFTGFFVDRGHTAVASDTLVPQHPGAPLFTNAGMNQFIPFFTGEQQAPYRRATSIQKCLRVNGRHDDIENVGRTARHATFFEMLGNFSFGDYFKEQAIPMAWALLTEVMGFDGDRLWVTIYKDDDQASDIWTDQVGFPRERIQRLAEEDNFWEMGPTGPCGPDSEIFFDRGASFGADGGPERGAEDRFCEVWNLVFMQFDRQLDGSLSPMPRPSIDTGAGLERVLTMLQEVPTIWETDSLRKIVAGAEAATGQVYGSSADSDVRMRIMADHSRAAGFLIGDGVMPSNEDRGYVLRRLIRRAVLQAHQMGVERPVMPTMIASVAEAMGEAYPALVSGQDLLISVSEREEGRFRSTLKAGMGLLEAELAATSGEPLSGGVAFRLHDTHGFPIELTREIVGERGLSVDEASYQENMARQREQSKRNVRPGVGGATPIQAYREILDQAGPTVFTGYSAYSSNSQVVGVVPTGEEAQVEIFLDTTPFYAEGGGQVGDTGSIETDSGRARVIDTTQVIAGLSGHLAVIEDGEIHQGQSATVAIDGPRRNAIRRNHTGTHLLHWALRKVLGDHVKQQGSLVAPDRLRFDFHHFEKVTAAQISEIEDLVNAQVLEDGDVGIEVMSKLEADSKGAIAFFDEKYGDEVRVITAGPLSTELCGGTHVDRLGQIGAFEIVSEGSVGANIRRIEATTGTATLDRMRANKNLINSSADLLRASPEELEGAIRRRLSDLREAEERIKSLQQASLAGTAVQMAAQAEGGSVVSRVDDLSPDQLRHLASQILSSEGVHTVMLGGTPDGSKVALVAMVAKGRSPSAPDLVAPAAAAVGGGGGGRNPEQAMAGGRDVSGLDQALADSRALLAEHA